MKVTSHNLYHLTKKALFNHVFVMIVLLHKVELLPHQRRALAWLLWRETQKPCGGILGNTQYSYKND